MGYITKPIGQHIYDENLHTKDDAWEIIVKAFKEKEIILCKVIDYDKKSGELYIDFHGNKGFIKKGYISQNRFLKIEYLLNKAIGVHVQGIMDANKGFYASRLEIENKAKEELLSLSVGEIVEGIVINVVNKKECAFVDLKEGINAYLSISDITYLPNTCCTISEFVKVGSSISAAIKFLPKFINENTKKTIQLSLVSLYGNFEEECKKYELESEYIGFAREDKLYGGRYYIIVNPGMYIRFMADGKIDKKAKVKVVLKEYNYSEKCIEAIWDRYVPISVPKKAVRVEYGSMFDSVVKSAISPFSTRDSDTRVFDSERLNGLSHEEIMKRVRNGQLKEGHIEILKIIGSLGFCTAKQILSFAFCKQKDLDIKSQNKLNTRIESLEKVGLIECSHFDNGIYRIYCLSENGYGFLKNYLRENRMIYTNNMMMLSPVRIKRMLATNQFMLALMERIGNFKYYHQQIIYEKNHIPIKVSMGIDFQSCVFLLEAVRRDELHLSEEKEKILDRYNSLFKNISYIAHIKSNPSFIKNKRLYLILICEDIEQSIQMNQIVKESDIVDYVFYTHDLQIFQGDVEFSLYRIDDLDRTEYHSVWDLIKTGKKCYTRESVVNNRIENHVFNSFPEKWLEAKRERWDDIEINGIEIEEDHNQNIEYLYRREFDAFLQIADFTRNSVGTEILWEPRLFFFGSGGAGKTSLIKLLAGQPFDSNEEKTYGVSLFSDLFKGLPWMSYEEQMIDHIQVWDFAGQGCDHILTNFLMTDASLCIVVVDARREELPDEWLDYIQMYAPRAKILLVINKIDCEGINVQGEEKENYGQIEYNFYSKKYAKNIVGIYRISCKERELCTEDLVKLENEICKQIISMEKQFSDRWVKGINSLRDWIRNYEYGHMTVMDFNRKHKELGLQKLVESKQTLKLCVKAGLCIHNDTMKNHIVLKPEWLTCALTKILQTNNFKSKKWQLTEGELIDIIENSSYEDIYQYSEGEALELIEVMEKMNICTKLEGEYIFPNFLPYKNNSKSIFQILEIDNWYELELRYDFLPPDIFPKLQVKLWNQQWNCCHEKVDDYEPDKGRIVFVQNNRLMMAYRYQNSIVLALRKKITEENNIENDGKEAIKKIREVLRDINISQKLEARNRETESKVQEYVVLMEQNDIRECKKIRFPYSKKNLRKICLKGIEERYFPEIDSFYNPTELLLEEYTLDKIEELYFKYVISIYTQSNSDTTFENSELRFRGSAFLFGYKESWYVVCCEHEVGKKNENIKYLVDIQGTKFEVEYIDSKYFKAIDDISVFRVDKNFNNYSHLFPEIIFPFKEDVKRGDVLYACGYTSAYHSEKADNLIFEKNQNENLEISLTESNKIIKGMSGTPILNLKNRCIVGMLIATENNKVIALGMKKIWKFFEENVEDYLKGEE